MAEAITSKKIKTSERTKQTLVTVESIDLKGDKNNKKGHMQTGEKFKVGENMAKELVDAGKAKIVK